MTCASFINCVEGYVWLRIHPNSVSIVPPTRCVIANPVILGEEVAEQARRMKEEDISWSWYIIADCGMGGFITIDLDQQRLGKCYDSFHETHGLKENTAIIALSFTELVLSLYEKRGNYWYWLQPDVITLGDAYDVASQEGREL